MWDIISQWGCRLLPLTARHVQRKASGERKPNAKLGLHSVREPRTRSEILAVKSQESIEAKADRRELKSRETLAPILSVKSPFSNLETS